MLPEGTIEVASQKLGRCFRGENGRHLHDVVGGKLVGSDVVRQEGVVLFDLIQRGKRKVGQKGIYGDIVLVNCKVWFS